MKNNFCALLARLLILLLATATLSLPAAAQTQRPTLLRDAEIEQLLRLYSRDVFKAAGLTPEAVRIFIVQNPGFNAFVTNGQRLYVCTGLLQQAATPNEVIGVLAHETAHIAAGDVARQSKPSQRSREVSSTARKLLGVATIVGATAAEQDLDTAMEKNIGIAANVRDPNTAYDQATVAGWEMVLGINGPGQAGAPAYTRVQEAAADQAAARYLDRAGISGRGMLDVFERLSASSTGTSSSDPPYLQSHPMPRERLQNLEGFVTKSPNYAKTDPQSLVLRHQLMQAKLVGLLSSPQVVYQKYPASDVSVPARYARAVAAVRARDANTALMQLNWLIEDNPKNPYFWELKGEALLAAGKPQEAAAALKQALSLAPKAGLIGIRLAEAQLAAGTPAAARQALSTLQAAQRTEPDVSKLYALQAAAYAKLGNVPMAELATAEAAFRDGDRTLAVQKARSAVRGLKPGSPEWLKAQDIASVASRRE
ncbi:MAG: M48 family metalloprotease [Hyphomicrobiales bacterium]